MTANFDVRIEYHSPDEAWAAVFIRNGNPWFLDGALVGMGADPSDAIRNLTNIAMWLIARGENFLTAGPISNTDREWLRETLSPLGDPVVWLAREMAR